MGLNPEIGLDAVTLDSMDMQEIKAVARAFQNRGRRITLHGPFMDLSPGSPDPAIRRVSMERMLQLLEVVPVCKPLSVVCHAGWERRRYDWIQDEWYDRSAAFWKDTAVLLRKRQCRLLLENVYEESPQDLLRLLEYLRSEDVGACLDTGHLFAFGSGGLTEWVRVLGSFVGEVHLHDNMGDKDSHLPPGQGRIDFSSLPALFRQQSGFPVITLEPHESKDLLPSLEWVARELKDFV
nr:sugar phosphate isomerase/epimerase family protein [Desulfobotulus pelophilus]